MVHGIIKTWFNLSQMASEREGTTGSSSGTETGEKKEGQQ